MGSCRLTTRRLVLRRFEPADGDALYSLYGDPAVMAIRKIGTQSRPQSDAQLALICDHWRRRGFGLWAVEDRASGAFLGECGLREIGPDAEPVELSYGLVPSAWGQGLASEAAAAAVEHGFRALGLPAIFGLARAANQSSLRVLGKLGFRNDCISGSGDDAVVRTVLTRDDWAARSASE